jgi:hypothetical protein
MLRIRQPCPDTVVSVSHMRILLPADLFILLLRFLLNKIGMVI